MLQIMITFFKAFVVDRASLAAENMALRQQLAVLRRSVKRPKLHKRDRIFWSWLSRLWTGWRSALLIVQPQTVARWHRLGFRLYWRWRSSSKTGRPTVAREIRDLIRRMSRENPIEKTRNPSRPDAIARGMPSKLRGASGSGKR
jgi:putative transposase